MHFQETMMRYSVLPSGKHLIGTHWELTDPEKVVGLMERAQTRFH
jgi:hypothetical protein